MLATADESAERELETQEEEQEHEPDLGQEVRHLRRANEAEHLRLVRPEEQAGEQVGGDCRQADAARREPERREQADGYRELGERHARLVVRP